MSISAFTRVFDVLWKSRNRFSEKDISAFTRVFDALCANQGGLERITILSNRDAL
jgi:hypothetical protein